MGDKASPFIADSYLWWCEYCYMSSYKCRYLEDICSVNSKYFGNIAKDLYDNAFLLEGSACC